MNMDMSLLWKSNSKTTEYKLCTLELHIFHADVGRLFIFADQFSTSRFDLIRNSKIKNHDQRQTSDLSSQFLKLGNQHIFRKILEPEMHRCKDQ